MRKTYSNYPFKLEMREIKSKTNLIFLKTIVNQACTINLRSNRKLHGIIRFVDHHFNMILSNAVEIRRQKSNNKGIKRKKGQIIERNIKNLIIRGDNIISISKL